VYFRKREVGIELEGVYISEVLEDELEGGHYRPSLDPFLPGLDTHSSRRALVARRRFSGLPLAVSLLVVKINTILFVGHAWDVPFPV
jgi:hypothetical protein